MSKINITGSVTGQNVQIGDNNSITTNNDSLKSYEKELLDFFNKYCSTESEKQSLIEDLKDIDRNSSTASNSAKNIKAFITSVEAGVVSSGIFYALEHMIQSIKK